jgi:hypothetical protein
MCCNNTGLDNTGLVPHPQKSTFVPVQEIVLLGFLINSLSMTIRLTVEKKEKIKSLVTQVMIWLPSLLAALSLAFLL